MPSEDQTRRLRFGGLIEILVKTITDVVPIWVVQGTLRMLHSGSALSFQVRGAGSIPVIRSDK